MQKGKSVLFRIGEVLKPEGHPGKVQPAAIQNSGRGWDSVIAVVKQEPS